MNYSIKMIDLSVSQIKEAGQDVNIEFLMRNFEFGPMQAFLAVLAPTGYLRSGGNFLPFEEVFQESIVEKKIYLMNAIAKDKRN